MTFQFPITFSAAALCLAACGGGGGDGSDPVAEYASDSGRAAQLVQAAEQNDQTAAAATTTLGRAEYDGIVGLAFGGTPTSLAQADMLGELDIVADFNRNTLSGEFDDFNSKSGRELAGDLRLTNGQITGTDFTADVSGGLYGTTDAPGAVTGTVSGEFLGDQADYIEGSGTANSQTGGLGIIFSGVKDRD